MKWNHYFFLLLLPSAWSAVSLLHFLSPGDEYAMWVISSMAGSWVLFFTPNVGDIHQWWIRSSVAITGFLAMSTTGWLLCWLKVRIRIWLALWLGFALGWLGFMLVQYPSMERALAKNGSWAAYILTATLLAAYSATLLATVGGLINHFGKHDQPSSAADARPTPTDVS